MAPMIAAQTRPPPPPVHPLCRLIVQPAGVHREPLHENGGASSNRIAVVLGQPLEEILVTEQRIRRPRGLECLEQALLSCCHGTYQFTVERIAACYCGIEPKSNRAHLVSPSVPAR